MCDAKITARLHNHLSNTNVDFKITSVFRYWDNPRQIEGGPPLIYGWQQVLSVIQMMALVLSPAESEEQQ